MRLRRLCLEIFALRRFFKEPIAGVSVDCASEAQAKHRLSKIANAFAAKSRGFRCASACLLAKESPADYL